jgi:signal transduction histidine kinase
MADEDLDTWQAVANQTWAGQLVVEYPCRITMANAAAVRLAGDRGDEVLGGCFCSIFITGTAHRLPDRCVLEYAMRGTERRVRPRWLPIEPGGVKSTVLFGATSLQGTNETGLDRKVIVTMVPSILVDEADRKRQEMLATALHDLRHPIAIQTISLELLEDQPLEARSPEAVSIMRRLRHATDYLAKGVENLQNRTLYELDVETHQPLQLALLPLVKGIAFQLEPILFRRRQTVLVRIPRNLVVWADPDALEHVLVNLLLNAHKYSVNEDRFEVSARRIKGLDVVELVVRDHGPGISKAERRRVFERFYRGAGSRGQKGAGLGLAIVQSLVARQGGTGGVRAARGGGAAFWVRLPLLQNDQQTSESAPKVLSTKP